MLLKASKLLYAGIFCKIETTVLAYQLNRLLGCLFSAERDEGVAPVQATQWVHH